MKATLGRRQPLQVFGDDYPTPDGTCIRDYIHVDDLADAHVKALDYLAAGGATTALNVGTGEGSSVMQVIEATARVSGRDVPHEIVGRRAGDPVAVFADPTLVHETLGWRGDRGPRRDHRLGVGVAQHAHRRLRGLTGITQTWQHRPA